MPDLTDQDSGDGSGFSDEDLSDYYYDTYGLFGGDDGFADYGDDGDDDPGE